MWTLFEMKVLVQVYRNFPEIYDVQNKEYRNVKKRKAAYKKIVEFMSLIRRGTTEEDIQELMEIYRRKYISKYMDRDYLKLIRNLKDDGFNSWHEEAWMYRGFEYFFEAERIPGGAPLVRQDFKQFQITHRDHFGRLIELFRPTDEVFNIISPQPAPFPSKNVAEKNLTIILTEPPIPAPRELPIREPPAKKTRIQVTPEDFPEIKPEDLIVAKKNEDLAKWKVLHKVAHDAVVMKDSTSYPKTDESDHAARFKTVMDLHKSLLNDEERELYGTLLESKVIKDFRKATTIESMYKALKKVFYWVMDEMKKAKDFEECELAKLPCSKCESTAQEPNEVIEEEAPLVAIDVLADDYVYEQCDKYAHCSDCGVCMDGAGIPIGYDPANDHSAPEPVDSQSNSMNTTQEINQDVIAGKIDPQVIGKIRDVVERLMYPGGKQTPTVISKHQKRNQKKKEKRQYKIDSWLLNKVRTYLEELADLDIESTVPESPEDLNIEPTHAEGPIVLAREEINQQETVLNRTDNEVVSSTGEITEDVSNEKQLNQDIYEEEDEQIDGEIDEYTDEEIDGDADVEDINEEIHEDAVVDEIDEGADVKVVDEDAVVDEIDERADVEEMNEDAVLEEIDERADVDEIYEDAAVEEIDEDADVGETVGGADVKSTEKTDEIELEAEQEVKSEDEQNIAQNIQPEVAEIVNIIVQEALEEVENNLETAETQHETNQETNDITKIINESQVVTDVNIYGSLKAKLKEVIKNLLQPIPTNSELLNNCLLQDLPKTPSTKTDGRVLYQRVTRSQAKKNWRIETVEDSDEESEEHDYSMCSSAYSTSDDSSFISTVDDSTESDDSLYMEFRDSLAQMESNKLGERNINYQLDIGVQSQADQVNVIESGCYFKPINSEELQVKLGEIFEESKYQPYANYFKETLHQKITAAAHKVSSTTKLTVFINKDDKDDTIKQTMSEALNYFFDKVISLAFYHPHLRICKKCGNYGPCFTDRICPLDPKYAEQTFNFTYDVASNSSNSDVTTTYQIIDNSSQNGDIFEPENQQEGAVQQPLVIWDSESWESFKEDIGDVLKVMKRFRACESCGKYDTCGINCQNVQEGKKTNEVQYRQQKSIEIQTNLDPQETKSFSKDDMCEPTMFQPLVTWDVETWESFRDDINDALKVVNRFKLCEKCGKFETCAGRCDNNEHCSEGRNNTFVQSCTSHRPEIQFKSVANSTSTEDANVMDLCDKCGALDMNFCERTCQNNQNKEPDNSAARGDSTQADSNQNQLNDTPFNQETLNNETVNQIRTNTTCNQHCREQFNNFQTGQTSNFNFNDVCPFHQFQYFKLFQSSNETHVIPDQVDLKSKSNEDIKLWFRLFVKRFTSIEDPKVVLQVQRDVDNVVYDALLK